MNAQDVKRLLGAVSVFFPQFYLVNLTKGVYRELSMEDGTPDAAERELDTLYELTLTSTHPADREAFMASLSQKSLLEAHARGDARVQAEFRSVGPDGAYYWAVVDSIFTQDEADGDVRSITLVRPVDRRTMREETEARLQKLLGFSALGGYEYVSVVNAISGAYELFADDDKHSHRVPLRANYDDALARICATMVPEADRKAYWDNLRLTRVLRRMQEQEEGFAYRYRLEENEGPRWYEVRYTYYNPEKTELLMTVRDIQSEWAKEDAARQSEARLKRVMAESLAIAKDSSGAKSAFLATLSDNLCEPLTAISGLAALCGAQPEDTKGNAERLREIDSAATQLGSLLSGCLDVARAPDRASALSVERFALMSLAEDAARIEADARAKGLIAEVDIAHLPDLTVSGNRAAISRMLVSLGDNAVRYTPKGGHVRLSADVKYQNGDMLIIHIEIEDDGPGMGEAFLHRAFEPFAQEWAGDVGAGLGLAICKRYADAIGALVTLRSKPGEGTLAALDIPLQAVDKEATLLRPAEVSAQAPAVSLLGRHILLAEDNELNAEIVVALLSLNGMAVDHAVNGREAVDQFLASTPGAYDAILMDIQMPVLGGMDAAAKIRKSARPDSASIPIIAMSANAFQEDLVRALQSGINDYITKPIELDRLLSALKARIGEREQGRHA